MKINIIKAFTLVFLMTILFSSCHNRVEVEQGELIDPNIEFYAFKGDVKLRANILNPIATTLDESDKEDVIHEFGFKFGKVLLEDVSVSFSLSEQGVKDFNNLKGTNYEALPVELVTLPKNIVLKKGAVKSPKLSLSVKLSEAIKLNKTYLFVIELNTSDGVDVFCDNNRIAYTLVRNEKSTDIKRTLELTRDVYLSSDKLDDDLTNKYPNSSFTVETFVNVQRFSKGEGSGISTLFGCESGTLFRFGDAGVPVNVLQVAKHNITEHPFLTNKWYHIAISYDQSIKTFKVYVNGKLVREQDMVQASLKCQPWDGNRGWYIGRSWDKDRGLAAHLSEMRIWSIVRSQKDINDSMFGVAPNSDGLIAYWMMNKAKGVNHIEDVTGHGYDLVLKGQKEPRDKAPVMIVNENEALSID